MPLSKQEKIDKQTARPEFKVLEERFLALRPVIMGASPLWKEYHNALKRRKAFYVAVIKKEDWIRCLSEFHQSLLPFYPQLEFDYED